jgi:hypothetical protein
MTEFEQSCPEEACGPGAFTTVGWAVPSEEQLDEQHPDRPSRQVLSARRKTVEQEPETLAAVRRGEKHLSSKLAWTLAGRAATLAWTDHR